MQAPSQVASTWTEPEHQPRHSVAELFADSIEHLYRVAMTVDPSPRSQIAYACYLSEHGQPLEAFREFDEILADDRVSDDREALEEIVHWLARTEQWLEKEEPTGTFQYSTAECWQDLSQHDSEQANDHDLDGNICQGAGEIADAIRQLMDGTRQRSPHDFTRIIAELDLNTLEDVGDLLSKVRQDRAMSLRRRTGISLLKLALYCGKRDWFHVEIECIREAIRCFAQVAMELRNWRLQARAELAAISMGRI